MHTLIKSVETNEECLKSAIWSPTISEKKELNNEAKRLQKLLCSTPEFWEKIKLIQKLLFPLADSILKIEGAIVDVRASYKVTDSAFHQSLEVSLQFATEQSGECKKVSKKFLLLI